MNEESELIVGTPMFQRSADGVAIYNRLVTTEVGEVITYLEMSGLIEGDIQNDKRHILDSARRCLRKERRMMFAVVRCVGVQRINGKEIDQAQHQRTKRVQRQAREGLRDLACVDEEDLTDDDRKNHHMVCAEMGFIEVASRATTRTKIAQLTLTESRMPTAEQVAGLLTRKY